MLCLQQTVTEQGNAPPLLHRIVERMRLLETAGQSLQLLTTHLTSEVCAVPTWNFQVTSAARHDNSLALHLSFSTDGPSSEARIWTT